MNHGPESGLQSSQSLEGWVQGFCFFLYNFNRKLLRHPTSLPEKNWLWGMFLEMTEMDPCSLSYQGAVSNIFKSSLAFFQKRRCLIYCNAYCDPCTAPLLTWPDHENHRQDSVSLSSLILVGGRRPAQQLSFLSVTDVHTSACFPVAVCPRGFQACELLAFYFLFGSFCNSSGILKK